MQGVCQENHAAMVGKDRIITKDLLFLTPAVGTAVADKLTKIRKRQYLTGTVS
jgi:hypothetical protein